MLDTQAESSQRVSKTLWTMEDIANRIEARKAKPTKRAPYKKTAR